MNDNFKLPLWCHCRQTRMDRQEAEHIAQLRDLASRAVTKPHSLTVSEIQEVGWGFLIASKSLATRRDPR